MEEVVKDKELRDNAKPSTDEKKPLNDPRWRGEDGWEKKRVKHETSDGRKIKIHFNKNKITGEIDDIKFKDDLPRNRS